MYEIARLHRPSMWAVLTHLQALKAFCLTHSTTPAQRQDGAAELGRLAAQSPPIVDLETLNLVQSALLAAAGPGAAAENAQLQANAMWERAVKAKPADEDLSREWFFSSFHREDWKSAQKVLLAGVPAPA